MPKNERKKHPNEEYTNTLWWRGSSDKRVRFLQILHSVGFTSAEAMECAGRKGQPLRLTAREAAQIQRLAREGNIPEKHIHIVGDSR